MATSSKRPSVINAGGGENYLTNSSRIGNLSAGPEVRYSDLKPPLGKPSKVDGVTSYEFQEAVELSSDSFPHSARDSSFKGYDDPNETSKVEKLLGNRKVADILLWRDDKKSFLCFLVIGLPYHSFFIAGRTFISSLAILLLLIAVLLCGHQIMPLNIFGFTIHRLSSSYFEISEVDVRNCFLNIKSLWDKLIRLTKLLSEGEDWPTFLKVSAFLYFCKLIPLNFLSLFIGAAIVISFTMCLIYEQYEEEIDSVATALLNGARNAVFSFQRNLPLPLVSFFSSLKSLLVTKINQLLSI